MAAHQRDVVLAQAFGEVAALAMLVTSTLVSPNLSAMSHTGTFVPMKLPEWITGLSGVAAGDAERQDVLGMRVHDRR